LLEAGESLEDNCVEPVEKGQDIGNKQHPDHNCDGLGNSFEDRVFFSLFFDAQLGHSIQNRDYQQ